MSLFSELRRRNVLKVALLYAVTSLLLVWIVNHAVSGGMLPLWASDFMLLLLAIGFPVALIFAWVYEITPQGLKKGVDVDQTQSIVYKTGQKLNAAVAVLAVLGVAALIGERLLPEFELILPEAVEEIPLRPVYDSPETAGVPKEITAYTMAQRPAHHRLAGPRHSRTSSCTTSCAPAAATSTRALPACRISSNT